MAEQQNGHTAYRNVDHSQQHEKTSNDSDHVDSRKLSNFITRALSESSRMSREAEGCREKKDRLLARFSKERISQLSKNNATEALPSHNSSSGDKDTLKS